MTALRPLLTAFAVLLVEGTSVSCGVDSSAGDPTPTAAAALAEVPVAATAATPRNALAFAWAIEQVDTGIWTALALRSDNVPHVVYVREGSGSFARRGTEDAIKSAVRSGTSWDVNMIAEGIPR